MSTAPVLAGAAAALAVAGAWEGLVVLEQAAPAQALGRILAPLQQAGRAGREPTLPERRRLAIVGTGGLLAGGWLLGGMVAGSALAAVAPALVGRLLAARRRRWRRALAEGAPAVARALADALSGGHAVRGALQELGRPGALAGPAAVELQAAAARLALGEPTETVLEHLRRRAADPGWDALVAAVLLQRRAGGDLARLLRSVAASCEHARRVEADARGMTAQARATARLLAGLPVIGLVLTEVVAPGALPALLADPLSRMLLLASLAVGTCGLVVIGRLARVGEA